MSEPAKSETKVHIIWAALIFAIFFAFVFGFYEIRVSKEREVLWQTARPEERRLILLGDNAYATIKWETASPEERKTILFESAGMDGRNRMTREEEREAEFKKLIFERTGQLVNIKNIEGVAAVQTKVNVAAATVMPSSQGTNWGPIFFVGIMSFFIFTLCKIFG